MNHDPHYLAQHIAERRSEGTCWENFGDEMNLRFNPQRERENLLKSFGIPRSRALDFAKYRSLAALDGGADGLLCDGITCHLVGLCAEGVELLEKAQEWEQAAIEYREIPRDYFPNWTEASRLGKLALCRWLLRGEHDQQSLDRAAEYHDLCYESCDDRSEQVSTSMVAYLDAGKYAHAIDLYQSNGLPLPVGLERVLEESLMAYVLCWHRLHKAFEDAEISVALRRFFARKVPQWLGSGQYATVAQWMKLTAWDGRQTGDSARRALLSCYDYLHGLKRPET